MPSHSSNTSPTPFPFLPVVLESPKTTSAHRSVPSSDVSDAASRAGTGRGKPRAGRRTVVAEAAQPPGMDVDGRNALHVEVVRSIAPERLTLLGAIVR